MPTVPTSLSALRQVLAARFPTANRTPDGVFSVGWPSLDEATGGLPKGALTELICATPSCGGELLLGQLLRQSRAHNLRAALIDAFDTFDPCSWPQDWLEHLVWVRAQNVADALQVSDLFARDANFGLIVLDLRHADERDLRRIPTAQWYRLQRATEQSVLPFLIETPCACVPSAQLRLLLERSYTLSSQRDPRFTLLNAIPFSPQRQRRHTALA
jgi:hypothetical protein